MCRLRPLSGMFCSGINGKEARDSIGPKSPRFRAKRIDTFPICHLPTPETRPVRFTSSRQYRDLDLPARALLLDPGKLAVLQRYIAPTKDGDTGPWRDWSDCRDKGTARLFRLQSMCR